MSKCPVCGSEESIYVRPSEDVFISRSIGGIVGPMSLCLECGIVYYDKDSLERIRKDVKEEEDRIAKMRKRMREEN